MRDLSRKDLAVTNGISCMGCHDQGMRKAKDEIRGLVLGGKPFSQDVRETVEALYPPTEKMDRMIEDDTKRFADAMERAGLDPTLKLNGVEMINALAQALRGRRRRQARGGRVRHDRRGAAQGGERLRHQVARHAAAARAGRWSRATSSRRPTPRSPRTSATRTAIAIVAAPAPKAAVKKADLSLISDKSLYKVGDTPVFTIVSARDCFLTITNVDDKGAGSVLFPNRFQQENKIKAGEEFVLPIATARFQYRFLEPRIESVVAVCTEKNTEVDGIKHNFTRSILTNVDQYTRSVARAIQVEPKKAGPIKSASAEREISRSSIIIRVR